MIFFFSNARIFAIFKNVIYNVLINLHNSLKNEMSQDVVITIRSTLFTIIMP